jgi:hypothetical protein
VRILEWLFGKKEKAAAHTRTEEKTAAGNERPAKSDRGSPDENLRRWQESGRPRAWVEAHHGEWNHEEWLGLLEELKRSPFWPMHPDDVGETLEQAKREWLRRN